MRMVCFMLLLAFGWLDFVAGSALGSDGWGSIETVRIRDITNSPDGDGVGAVGYEYCMAKRAVTNGQYAAFLNHVARVGDPYGLYARDMGESGRGGIVRHGRGTVDDPYGYDVTSKTTGEPVSFVSFYDAVRFANWMHNGQGDGDTESGVYAITRGGPDRGQVGRRHHLATWVVPNESEWYKGLCYDPTGGRRGAYRPMTASGRDGRQMPASYYGVFGSGDRLREWTESGGGDGRVVRGSGTGDSVVGAKHQGADTGFRMAYVFYDGGLGFQSGDGRSGVTSSFGGASARRWFSASGGGGGVGGGGGSGSGSPVGGGLLFRPLFLPLGDGSTIPVETPESPVIDKPMIGETPPSFLDDPPMTTLIDKPDPPVFGDGPTGTPLPPTIIDVPDPPGGDPPPGDDPEDPPPVPAPGAVVLGLIGLGMIGKVKRRWG